MRHSDCLMRWNPSEPVPAEAVPGLEQSIAIAESLLEPANAQAWSVSMKRLLSWVEMYGVIPLPLDKREKAQKFIDIGRAYQTALPTIPGDLLYEAVRRVIENHKWSTLPKPADLKDAIRSEWEDRKARLFRMKTAKELYKYRKEDRLAVEPRRKPTDAEKELVSKLAREAIRKLDAA